MKILTICPTIYPDKMERMLTSYQQTRSHMNNMVISTENTNGNITYLFNRAFLDNPDYDYYFMANDDIIFKTNHWDKILANKNSISYGDDLLQSRNLCTFPMIDGDIVRALGWLQMPTLNRYCGDIVWKFIGENLNLLKYYPNVIIEHKWEGQDDKVNKEDMARFAAWLPNSHKDINKIKEKLF